ncbi:hypothetical protein ACEWY4_026107 [Coilia grayii]|uniref:Glycosyltransferase family 92 protein n=1 Tax=Coilia grayii TaxID=363190 RepID=A0ABD1IXK1_9TELE
MKQRYLGLLVGICTFTASLLMWWHQGKIPWDQHRLSALLNQPETADNLTTHISELMVSTLKDHQTDRAIIHEEPETADTITRIHGSKHLMVSAFKDHRRNGAIRVISIIKRQDLQELYCVLCVHNNASTKGDGALSQCVSSKAQVEIHRDHFGFPYGTSDVFCTNPSSVEATHVSISTDPNATQSLKYLPIQNKEIKETFNYNFTVCISTLFGEYNNALQFVQAIEVYKLIGIQRLVIYNNSCGPDVEKVLKHYSKEGTLEVVPWPIDKFLKPSHGWLTKLSPGDLHYYGQITALNECIHRYMYQSRYLLLNDIDEIIMPYKHKSLGDLMDTLQKQHSYAGVFTIETHVFPKTQSDDSGRFSLPEWKSVPGVNILQHIYREPIRKGFFNPSKMIINPRRVEQTSVHSTLRQSGPVINVPYDVCRVIHVRTPEQPHLRKEQLYEDKKLWEFEEKLIPNINHALNESGLLLKSATGP